MIRLNPKSIWLCIGWHCIAPINLGRGASVSVDGPIVANATEIIL
jgi:hypothetical protein